MSEKKFKKEKASNNDRQKWARIIIASVEAYARILELVELEGLSDRLKQIETRMGVNE